MNENNINANPTNPAATTSPIPSEPIGAHSEPIKPLHMLRNEFMDTLIKAANECKLPFVIMEYVVRDFYEEVRSTAARQYEKDKEDYENALSKVSQ